MKDRIVPVVVGLMVGWLTIFALEKLNHFAYPMPEGADLSSKEAIARLMASIPAGAFVLLFASWMVSAAVSGMVTSKINPDKWRDNVIIVGVVLSIGALINMVMIPHPTWLIVASAAGYIPFAYLGGKIVNNRKNEARSYY